MSEDNIEIEQHHWRQDEIRFVELAELQGGDAAALEHHHPGDDHADKQEQGKRTDVFFHGARIPRMGEKGLI